MKVLVALGGNAILQRGERGTAQEQLENVKKACMELTELILAGHRIAITHGNGPQVGDILLKNELARETLPPMPLDVLGAESQGMLGYMIQQTLQNTLSAARLERNVTTIVTQTLVDPEDPAFTNPTKPIGPFYTEEEAEKLRAEKKWTLINDAGRGYRRVVPSPTPIAIVEGDIIRQLFEAGVTVIAAGGGGIPVVNKDADKSLQGVEAVIDKDLAASLLATTLGAETLMLLTDVEQVYLNYGRPNQQALRHLTIKECETYLKKGEFPSGSMGPKIQAAVQFVRSGGAATVIASLDLAKKALEGHAGTSITKA